MDIQTTMDIHAETTEEKKQMEEDIMRNIPENETLTVEFKSDIEGFSEADLVTEFE